MISLRLLSFSFLMAFIGMVPCLAQSQLQPVSIISQKTHGTAGAFNIDLPLTGTPGIECRTGGANGDYKIVLTFAHAITFDSAAVTTAGTGSVASTSTSGDGTKVTVNLSGVSNAQTITVRLFGVRDGTNANDVSVPMGVLIGDTTGNGAVNSSDIAQTKSHSGQLATASNFRSDVNVSGSINSSDIGLVESKSGTALPFTTFTFNLDASYKTSAGVYKDGVLIRTLWRKVPYGPGSITRIWDGNDDSGAAVPAGVYEIRLLHHNVQYVWDGVIGNTSTDMSGAAPHRASTFMQSLAIDGTKAFYAVGENEGFTPVRRFETTAPQSQTTVVPADYLTGFDLVATDGIKVYISNGGSGFEQDLGPYTTFVIAHNVSDNMTYPFPSGTPVTVNNNGPSHYSSCIDVDFYTVPSAIPTPTPDSRLNPKRPTGLAVQKSGNILAVAHGGLNVVRLFNKTSGAFLRNISITNPEGLATASDGDLWAITGNTVRRYLASALQSANPTPIQTISGFSDPVAVAVHPSNPNLVLVADGGNSQRVRAVDRTITHISNAIWNYGQAGGYSTNGPDVTGNKFAFQVGGRDNPVIRTALAVQSDGSFWIGDGATSRLLHINSSHTGAISGDTIMFLPHNGWAAVDPNNPRRVIGDSYLEFDVDYTKPIQQGWSLKKNWAAGLDAKYLNAYSGINSVSTLSNGRVYGTINDAIVKVVVELPGTANQPLRICKDAANNDLTIEEMDTAPDFYGSSAHQFPSFESDGSLRYERISQQGTGALITWYKKALSAMPFDSSGNPRWDNEAVLASAPYVNTDPVDFENKENRHPITSSGILISFDQNHTKAGIPPGTTTDIGNWQHLGGVSLGGNVWKWRSSPTVSAAVPFDGLGSFDIGDGVQYGGSVAMALGKNVIYGYLGEFWNQTEASQWMHFYDDGLFVGQFGTPGTFRNPTRGALAGFSGNAFYPTLVGVGGNNQPATNGETYLWANDQSHHSAIHRWHILGTNTIREQSGTGLLGNSISLVGTPVVFPTALSATPGNGQVILSWTAGAGAPANYNVKRSTTSGGPYTTVLTTPNTNCIVPGLTNGTLYYFVVSAMGNSRNSNQVQAFPFDKVGIAGRLTGGARDDFQVSSTAPLNGQPALVGLSDVVGNLTRTSVGTKGYVIYNWAGGGEVNNQDMVPHTVKKNVLTPFNVTVGSGWFNQAHWVSSRFIVDGVQGTEGSNALNNAALNLYANSSGSINITVSDTATHYVTVFCPDLLGIPRSFDIKMTPQNQSAPVASFTVDDSIHGDMHVFQFVFAGNVKLSIENGIYNEGATLQAVFLD